jgi:endonuclease G
VRREDVAWGKTYDELRRANGDTYHVTNCSPQVMGFNRSNLGGLWGELENLVLQQAKASEDKFTVFSGPILDRNDPPFAGFDDEGRITVRIPRRFWKIVVANTDAGLQSFAFLLDQDLSDTDFGIEAFEVDADWRGRMISIADIEKEIGLLEFRKELHDSDQFDRDAGESVRREGALESFGG